MNDIKVSFVIPSHNCAAWLPHAVASAMCQSSGGYPFPDDWVEVVVVDDGSTDSTPDYLAWAKQMYGDKLQVIRHETALGRSAARNAGNKAARGEVILVLDADDVADPKRALSSYNQITQQCKGFIYGGATIISPVGEKLGEIHPEPFDLEKARARKFNGIVHSTVAYRKESALQFPYRDGEISALGIDDWAQQIEMATAGLTFDFIPRSLGLYRQLTTAISKTRDQKAVLAAKDAFLATLAAPAGVAA